MPLGLPIEVRCMAVLSFDVGGASCDHLQSHERIWLTTCENGARPQASQSHTLVALEA